MSDPAAGWETPYGTTPGSSTPSPDVGPISGRHELRTFFWLAITSTAIIGVAGTVAWLIVH
ncbi:MAG: hypothetical protein WAN74_03805 [Thermoplasmata archaeon]